MKTFLFIIVLSFVLNAHSWTVDFSRRSKYLKKEESIPLPVVPGATATVEPLSEDRIIGSHTPASDVVILNTSEGFVPKSLALRKGIKYKFHIVNVNEKEKNVSFIMGSFQQHHGTYYGQIKTFEVTPSTEGVYTFQSPETAWEGKVVILPQVEESQRGLATEK